MVVSNKIFKTQGEIKMIKKVILLGRKPGAAKALKWLLQNGVMVSFVVVDPKEKSPLPTLKDTAEALGIQVYTEDETIYWMIQNGTKPLNDIDLVISYLHNRKIRKPLFELGAMGCINFHPAPLPDYKSSAGYNMAIMEKRNSFGVSAHFIDSEKFDSGPIIKVKRFPINHSVETAISLEKKTQEKLFHLFTETMEDLMITGGVTTSPNSEGLYLNRQQLESLKVVDPEKDSSEEIHRKIRAFFFPPYHGAKIMINGEGFTLIDDETLKYLAWLIHQ